MKARNLFKLLVLIFSALLILVGCNSEKTSKDDEPTKETEEKEEDSEGMYSLDDFNMTKENLGEAIDGGEINVAIVSSTPFAGTLIHIYQTMTTDYSILSWFNDGLLERDENFFYSQDGPATFELDDSKKVWTLTIRDNVNWHNGEPVTAEDLELAYKIIGHPEYDGTYYGSDEKLIEGMEEYHAGETDSISGIEVIDEKTIEIIFLEADPFVQIWGHPVPKHIFGDMDISEISASPEVRENPIGFGPFKVEHIVPGESVVLVKNEDYWRGEPNLDQVTLKVIDSSNIVQEIKTGGVDIASFPTTAYPDNDDLTNVEIIANISNGLSYIGFRLGTWDEDLGEVKPDLTGKMGDKKLRQAMWHAVDNDLVANKFFHGLVTSGTTLIPPFHGEFHDETNPGRPYDPEKANEILDEAGYEWEEGEKFRTDPDGDELTIIFSAPDGGDTAEPIAKYYMQAWEDIGLNVELLNGRLQESNNYYEMLKETGEADFDVFMGSAGLFSNPDPRIFNGPSSSFNYPRWQSDETNELLAAGGSIEAFDTDYLKEVYDEWQAIMVEEVPQFPTRYGTSMMAINNRILNYSLDRGDEKTYYYELAVTQDEPFVHGE